MITTVNTTGTIQYIRISNLAESWQLLMFFIQTIKESH